MEDDLTKDGINITEVDPRCLFNCDESGFALQGSGDGITFKYKNNNSDNKSYINISFICYMQLLEIDTFFQSSSLKRATSIPTQLAQIPSNRLLYLDVHLLLAKYSNP